MKSSSIRVRFAPSPTGFMHLGNVRAALMNYLFAKQKDGTFIIRIEDTDAQRNVDPAGKNILADLKWLSLDYQEGPVVGGPYAPYYQSERSALYNDHLEDLIQKGLVYRCFCTAEELEKKRARQIALKMAPRYDRACLRLPSAEVKKRLDSNMPFIWRFELRTGTISITDLARGTLTYDFSHFSDFPLTRADGSFTFIFANFVDDKLMKISHIIRGEDHLTNTAIQAALGEAFNVEIPLFWHLPIICNTDGKKLSKRDFGFSLNDLRDGGFLPEAIDNYLAIIGGSFEEEIMDIDTLVKTMKFDHITASGPIKYDVEKLRWVNHKWMQKISLEDLVTRSASFLSNGSKALFMQKPELYKKALEVLRGEITVLTDIPTAMSFLTTTPSYEVALISKEQHAIVRDQILNAGLASESLATWVTTLGALAKTLNVAAPIVFTSVRVGLTGKTKGPALKDIIELLGEEEAKNRLRQYINYLK